MIANTEGTSNPYNAIVAAIQQASGQGVEPAMR